MDIEQIRSIDVLTGQINALPQQEDPGDKALQVTFKLHSHFNDVKTREEGRPIFEMAEYILITIPGDTNNVFRPVRENDKTRFPDQWLRFKAGQEQVQGTPLSSWPQLSRAQVDELAYFRILTVEQLALCSDVNCQKYMGLSSLRDQAKRYLDKLREDAPMQKVEAALNERDEQIRAMQAQMANMQQIIAEMSKVRDRKPDLVASGDDELFDK